MKCTICGNEVAPNEQFCANCGTKVSEMGANFGQAKNTGYGGIPGYGQPSPMGNSFAAGSGKSSMNPALMKVIVFIVVAVLGLGFVFLRDNLTKKQDYGDFTATVPISCKKTDEQNKYSLGTSSDATSLSYGNGRMEFSMIKFNTSSGTYAGVADTVTAEEFTKLMEGLMGPSLSGFESRGRVGDTMKFVYTSEGDKIYTEMKTVIQNGNIYLMVCQCLEKNTSRYSSKFSKFFSSISFK